MIEANGVSRWFGDVVAVSDVSFTIGAGVTALLGPNGAGKSTLLRMLCGLSPANRGTVRVLGADPRTDLAVRRRISIVPQQEAVFERMGALDLVRLAAILTGVPEPEDAARNALSVVEMDADDPRPVTSYSKGMKQRVKVAQALVNDPAVLMLDEPLTGLDPRQRRHLIELFALLGEQGRCVLVSSHVLDEVERFGSRVLVIAQGRLAATGDYRAIRDLMDDRPHRIRVRTDKPREVAASLLLHAGVEGATVVPARAGREPAVLVDTADAPTFRRSVAAIAHSLDAQLWEVTPLDDDLESVFRYLVQP
ncbi:MAG TPA: ABC transporter ATP-binding protein [Acidimicrobiales bacterium]|jgi:ABC-2 type transport system ATP-binding protein|nr:ABC transporter ATP-binding protein [Acidimicrobiales bacterium]